MFTGIVQAKLRVDQVQVASDHHQLCINFPEYLKSNLLIGASIAVNGVCLTVTRIDQESVFFDVITETLRITNLANLRSGDSVNIERSLKFGDEVGGHILSGHVDTMAEVASIVRKENICDVELLVGQQWMKYLLHKGYVALNGASLTLLNPNLSSASFQVSLIPETLRQTNLSEIKVGDQLNLEIDRTVQAVVETIQRLKNENSGLLS